MPCRSLLERILLQPLLLQLGGEDRTLFDYYYIIWRERSAPSVLLAYLLAFGSCMGTRERSKELTRLTVLLCTTDRHLLRFVYTVVVPYFLLLSYHHCHSNRATIIKYYRCITRLLTISSIYIPSMFPFLVVSRLLFF